MRLLRKVIVTLPVLVGLSSYAAFASSQNDIYFPITELGNCQSQEECRVYCDQRENLDVVSACVAFAKAHNLIAGDEIQRAVSYIEAMAKGGPGGCKNEKACRDYCDDPRHLPVCATFVEKYDLATEEEIVEMKKIARAVERGSKLPGECRSKNDCEAYCEKPDHAKECIAFAEASGILDGEELEEAKKILPFIERGETPGGCTRKDACEKYCEADQHIDECVAFGERSGFLSPEEVALIKKTGGRGPGGCRGRVACETFCNDASHQQECLRFAAEYGMMTLEEATQFGAVGDFQSCIAIAPEPVIACIRGHMGDELFSAMIAGKFPVDAKGFEATMQRVRLARTCLDESTMEPLQELTGDLKGALVCLTTEFGPDIVERIEEGRLGCREIGDIQAKMTVCIEKALKEKIATCFSKPCEESLACFQSLQDRSTNFSGLDVEPQKEDPAIREKMELCSREKIRSCIDKPCSEAISCFESLGGEGEEGDTNEGSGDPEVDAKISTCMIELYQEQGQDGQQPPVTYPSPEPPKESYPTEPVIEQPVKDEPYPYPTQEYTVDCSAFATVPSCSYITDPQGYDACKKCYPEK